jgi:quercetin dioxygenase-like cupin family protein
MRMKVFFINADEPWQELGGGMRRKILPWADDLMAVCVSFDKGAVGTLHSHGAHTQIGYIAAGSFEATVNGEKRTLRAGDAYLAVKDAPHGAVALENGSMILDVFNPKRDDFLK